MVLLEKQISAVWLIHELKEAERRKPGSWLAVWKEVVDVPSEGGEDPARERARSVKTFQQAVTLLEDLLPRYDELARLTALPWREFDARYPEFAKKADAANLLAGYVLPNMGKFVAVHRRAQARMALFRAALAVVQGGPDRLKDFKDPFGDGPFEYRALDRGFELRSKFRYDGKPLTLTVGQAKKE
jgi:hypothetical protein